MPSSLTCRGRGQTFACVEGLDLPLGMLQLRVVAIFSLLPEEREPSPFAVADGTVETKLWLLCPLHVVCNLELVEWHLEAAIDCKRRIMFFDSLAVIKLGCTGCCTVTLSVSRYIFSIQYRDFCFLHGHFTLGFQKSNPFKKNTKIFYYSNASYITYHLFKHIDTSNIFI